MKPYYDHNGISLYQGHCLDVLAEMEPESVHCVVTSPPYFGLRSYLDKDDPDKALEIGLESTPDEYIAKMVAVFREVKRVLRGDGTLWVNVGDSFASGKGSCFNPGGGESSLGKAHKEAGAHPLNRGNKSTLEKSGLKPKDLLGIPWMLAFALRADGWWLRSEITWCKKAPMPESVTDRPTSATEKLFLLAKGPRYFYDHVAVRVPSTGQDGLAANFARETKDHIIPGQQCAQHRLERLPTQDTGSRNLWNYWLLGPEPSSIPHYATFPTKLVEPCILAGTSEKGCCPECGQPWERAVEPGQPNKITTRGVQPWAKETGQRDSKGGLPLREIMTTGWQPTCKCPPAEPIPCTVLDPFCGTATTGVVSIRHRRRFVGIDLKREYLDLGIENMDGRAIRLPLPAAAQPHTRG